MINDFLTSGPVITGELLELEAMKHDIGVTYGMGGVSDESFKLPDGTVIQDSDVANCHQVLFLPELLGEHNILNFYILLPIHIKAIRRRLSTIYYNGS